MIERNLFSKQGFSAVQIIADLSHAVQFFFSHGAAVQHGQVFPHLFMVFCTHHTDIHGRIRKHEPITIDSRRRGLARGHFFRVEEFSPTGCRKGNNPGPFFSFKEWEGFGFSPPCARHCNECETDRTGPLFEDREKPFGYGLKGL